MCVDLEFSEDQEELRRSVRDFLQNECGIEVVRSVVESGEPARKLWEAMVGLDWPALAIEEEYGGLGLGFVEIAVVAEELGRVVAPGPYLATATQYAPVVAELGSVEQKKSFLGSVASGASSATLAFADHPNCWSFDTITSTTAEKRSGEWIVTGKKHAVLADTEVSEIAVVAKVRDGLGVFLVPSGSVKIEPIVSFDASRPLANVVLDNVSVSKDRVLGDPGSPEVLIGLTRALEEAAVAMALETVGTCQSLFDLTLAYTKDRHQFGVPIGSFQVIKHKMADLYVAIERARALCYLAVAAIAEEDEQRPLATAMAKAASDDCQRLVCQESLQSLGGIGFTWEHDAHLYVKRAKTTGSLFGSAKEHRLAIASALGVSG